MFYGVDFFRTAATLGQPRNTVIVGNTFRFDGYTYSGAPTEKAVVNVASSYAQRDILIVGNVAISSDATVGTTFLTIAPQTVAGQAHENVVCKNNMARGCNKFLNLRTNATNGSGLVSVENNTLVEPLATPVYTVPIGFFVDAVGPVKTLRLTGNSVIDERGSPQAQYGTYMNGGTVNNFYYSGNWSKGLTQLDYYEAAAMTYTTFTGELLDVAYTPAVVSGTAITLGNGSVSGSWSLSGDMVTANARLNVGSTTTFPGGTLTFSVPFTAKTSGRTYFGQYRIFDTSASIFRAGVCAIDGTANTVTLVVDGATNATNSSPIPLANGDSISLQIADRKA